jgi:hypothetical protein
MKDKKLIELVSELQKNSPNQTKIKELFLKLSLPFSTDPIEQMATVLMAIDRQKGVRKNEASI